MTQKKRPEHHIFDRYKFTGKLGSPEVEHMFNEALWDRTWTSTLNKAQPMGLSALYTHPELTRLFEVYLHSEAVKMVTAAKDFPLVYGVIDWIQYRIPTFPELKEDT